MSNKESIILKIKGVKMNPLILAAAPALDIVCSVTKGMALDEQIKQLEYSKKALQNQRMNEKIVLDEGLRAQKKHFKRQEHQSSKYYEKERKKNIANYTTIKHIGKMVDVTNGETKRKLQQALERKILESL